MNEKAVSAVLKESINQGHKRCGNDHKPHCEVNATNINAVLYNMENVPYIPNFCGNLVFVKKITLDGIDVPFSESDALPKLESSLRENHYELRFGILCCRGFGHIS